MASAYVHGYDPRENLRLQDQASTLVELLHSDTVYPAGSSVLEAGCGVGAQTVTLASNSPKALITSIDVAEASIVEARKMVCAAGIKNVTLRQADIFHLPFLPASFDHVFLCFVLEHLVQPIEALRALKRVLKPGGTITVPICTALQKPAVFFATRFLRQVRLTIPVPNKTPSRWSWSSPPGIKSRSGHRRVSREDAKAPRLKRSLKTGWS
jgi:ubiquinone/menaquinone biosynthesis C-methylase UbiE